MTIVRITQVRSSIGRSAKQRKTLQALGLNKVNSSREHALTPNIQGMINRVAHLVRVEGVRVDDQTEKIGASAEEE